MLSTYICHLITGFTKFYFYRYLSFDNGIYLRKLDFYRYLSFNNGIFFTRKFDIWPILISETWSFPIMDLECRRGI